MYVCGMQGMRIDVVCVVDVYGVKHEQLAIHISLQLPLRPPSEARTPLRIMLQQDIVMTFDNGWHHDIITDHHESGVMSYDIMSSGRTMHGIT